MRRSGVFWGGLLVVIGILVLLGNLGIIAVDVWSLIWPLFLLGLGLWVLVGVLTGSGKHRTERATIPLEGASEARIHIDHGAGRLRIGAGAQAGELLSGEFGGGLSQDVRRQGDRLNVRLRLSAQVVPFSIPWGRGSLDWEISLSPEVPLQLEIKTGASDSRLDLSRLRVTDLRLETGASSTDIVLPAEAGHTRADIKSGMASVTIRVPNGVAAHIHSQGGLSSTRVAQRFARLEAGRYQSPDYQTATNKLELNIKQGMGSVEVR